MKRGGNNKGFTFIDVTLAIVLMAAGYLALGTVLSNTSVMNMKCETGTTALMLARGKMAEMRAKDFSSVSSIGTTYFTGSYSGYRYAVTVSNVEAADLDTPVVGPTDYKKIDVAVTYAGGASTVHLYDVVTDLQ